MEKIMTLVVLVRNEQRINTKTGKCSIEGTIGDNFIINPIQNDTENKHIVTKLKTKDLANDYLIPEIEKTENDENQRQRRSAPSVVRPEVLVVVDSTLYAKLGKDTSATNQYIRNFWSAVNLRFRTISNPKVALNIASKVISKTYVQKYKLAMQSECSKY